MEWKMGLFALFSAATFATGAVRATQAPADQTPSSVPTACSMPDSWAASSALVQLYNQSIIPRGGIDPAKTKVTLLASEKSGDRYRLVHHILFAGQQGKSWSVIARSDADANECSLGDVELWLVERPLSPTPVAPQ